MKFDLVGERQWECTYNEKCLKFDLFASSVTNRFNVITDFVERMSAFHGEEFDKWFVTFIESCENAEEPATVIADEVDRIKYFCNTFLDSLNLDLSQFVDTSKQKAGSIMFVEKDLDLIIRLSSYLKIYSFILNNKKFKIGSSQHRLIYNRFASEILKTDVVSKIFDVIKTKTFRYNMTDRFMWDYIKTIQGKDIGVHIIEIFNKIMNNILVSCEETKNPITYFVSVVNESIKWFLRSVYKGTIIYDDEISTEDIHANNEDNLRSYSFNDTLGRLKTIAFEKIYDKLDREQVMKVDGADRYIEFNNRIATIEFVSPVAHFLSFPLLSRMTGVPYVHFKTVAPDHAAVLSYYLSQILYKVFRGKYRNFFSFLEYYPLSQPFINTSYRIKMKSILYMLRLQNEVSDFFGFNHRSTFYTLISQYVGRISRLSYSHLVSGERMPSTPLVDVEQEMIHFFTYYFSGGLDDKIQEMTKLMDQDF